MDVPKPVAAALVSLPMQRHPDQVYLGRSRRLSLALLFAKHAANVFQNKRPSDVTVTASIAASNIETFRLARDNVTSSPVSAARCFP